MKTIITLSLLILTSLGFTQGQYQQKMGEAMQNYAQVASVQDYATAASNFELIANAASTEWLPLYYHAQCYIMMSFSDREASAADKDAYLEVAESSIDKMITIAPNESEVYALKALYYTAKLVVDPMTRGQKYGILTNTAIQESLARDAQNPRAKQLALSNKVGTAEFFGKDISEFKAEAEQLLADWDNYEIRGPFHPTWGKDQVEGVLAKFAEPTENTTSSNASAQQTLTIEIKKLKSETGNIMLEVLDENEEMVLQTMGEAKNGFSTIVIKDLEPGTYAIRFYHDVNGNNKMDQDKYGRPTEAYGFSNNARGFMSAPKFKKMLFVYSESTTINMKAK
ncbi:MAG: DUF2141 domain-containing protein [Crocinitomix sp.]|nr:DUF2141 domain-containing protein [Crocinitomix sp.]